MFCLDIKPIKFMEDKSISFDLNATDVDQNDELTYSCGEHSNIVCKFDIAI